MYGSYGVLVNLSKVDGKIPFSSSALNLVIESIKVGGCALGMHTHAHTHAHTSSPSRLEDVHTLT